MNDLTISACNDSATSLAVNGAFADTADFSTSLKETLLDFDAGDEWLKQLYAAGHANRKLGLYGTAQIYFNAAHRAEQLRRYLETGDLFWLHFAISLNTGIQAKNFPRA